MLIKKACYKRGSTFRLKMPRNYDVLQPRIVENLILVDTIVLVVCLGHVWYCSRDSTFDVWVEQDDLIALDDHDLPCLLTNPHVLLPSPKTFIGTKPHFGHLVPQNLIFRWLGICSFEGNRLQETEPIEILHKPPKSYSSRRFRMFLFVHRFFGHSSRLDG